MKHDESTAGIKSEHAHRDSTCAICRERHPTLLLGFGDVFSDVVSPTIRVHQNCLHYLLRASQEFSTKSPTIRLEDVDEVAEIEHLAKSDEGGS